MRRFAITIALLTALSVSSCTPPEETPTVQSRIPTVGKPEAKSVSGPAIKVVETEINLGTIPPDQQQVIGQIFFFNVGTRPLQVRKVSGPCPCFASYSGDKFLQPDQGGVLEIRFDKTKIEAGSVDQLVNIETNDPANKVAKVHFKFYVERDPQEEQIRILKTELTSIRRDLRALHKDMAKVLTAVEAGRAAKPKRQPDTTIYDITIGSSPILGPKDAPVTIVEFVDFQCPYCIREYQKIKQILQEYPDKVRLVFKHYPLKFHKKAGPAHAVAELARLQGGPELFWKMHDMIMAEPKKLDVTDLREHAKSLNLDLARFDEVIADENRINDLLRADFAEAKKCKVRGTPTVLINGLKLVDRTVKGYRTRIEQIQPG